MMQRTRQTVSLSGLSRLPITVPITPERVIVDMAEAMREYGEVPSSMQVTVASAKGKVYAVDGLDVIDACRSAGIRDVPCTVIEVADEIDALRMHVDMSAGVSVNPCAVVDAIAMIEENGLSLKNPTMELRYRSLFEQGMSEKLKKSTTDYLHKMAKETYDIYDLRTVLRPIVRLDDTVQADVFNMVTKHIKIMNSVPDSTALDRMISEYAKRSGSRVTIPGIETGEDPEEGQAGEVKAVTVGSKDAGYFYTRTKDALHLTCKCEQEWYIERKSGTVREIDDSHSGITILRGDHGDSVYLIPEGHVKYLDLDIGTTVFHVHLAKMRKRPSERHPRGGAILTTRRRPSRDVIRKINELLESE